MATNDHRDLNLNIDVNRMKSLFKTKPQRHAFALILDWIIIFATIILCIQFFNPILYVLAVIIIGARMHALAILMHDAAHYRFLKNRKWNDIITNITTMYPVYSSIEIYRKNHFDHHNHLNTEDDPDWFAKLGKKAFQFPKTKREFLLTVLSYFALYRGLNDAFWFLKRFSGAGKKKNTSSKDKVLKIGFYLTLILVLSVFGLWKYYLLYWVVPYFSTFFMFQYIRSVAEHFGELSYEDLLSSTRSFKTNAFESFFFAPHNVGYHLEHHLYPGVPFYNLPKLHQLLMENVEYNSSAHVTTGIIGGLMNELGHKKA